MVVTRFIKCFTSPNLYYLLDITRGNHIPYQATWAERYGNNILNGLYMVYNTSIYTSPFWLAYMFKRDWFTKDGLLYLQKVVMGVGTVIVLALFLRACGRMANPVYGKFLQVLTVAQKEFSPQAKQALSLFDMDFAAWPVEFNATENPQNPPPKGPFADGIRGLFSWLMVHTFGIKLVYPGSASLLYMAVQSALSQGRAKMIMEQGGVRYKIKSGIGNEVETMFFDRRKNIVNNAKGGTLVISCDGNAGFYEIGVCSTPISAGYSVLCWNHPGFGGSTGTPYPHEERSSADAVLQFAIKKLGFTPEKIILHGWSIGGYSVSWLAMQYPDVSGVVIDASFDHLLPLAIPRMPESLSSIVKSGVSNYINLNVAEQLCNYKGPIRLIRRSMDEMITVEDLNIATNRGNYLLKSVLESRFPELMSDKEAVSALDEYLSLQHREEHVIFIQRYKYDEKKLLEEFRDYFLDHEREYPLSEFGSKMLSSDKTKFVLFLASMYMRDYDSQHCTPLPVEYFVKPWDIFSDDAGGAIKNGGDGGNTDEEVISGDSD